MSVTPTFTRIRAEAYPGGEGAADGTAATYNIAELAAWITAVTGWVAPTTSYDPAERTYLETCLTAAIIAKYTQGTQTGGAGQHSTATGVGTSILARLLQLGIQANDTPSALPPQGVLNVVMPNFTLVGTCFLQEVACSLAVTMPNFTVVGTGFVPASSQATLAVTMPDFTLASTVVVPVTCSLAVTMPDFTLAGTADVAATVNLVLDFSNPAHAITAALL